MEELEGQILPETQFGKLLTDLARWADTIVEIGTWHGGGSTKCIHLGMDRPEQRFWTIESDAAKHHEASMAYSDPRICFIYGSLIVPHEQFAESCVGLLPNRIDLLLIDGHDEYGSQELDLLIHRCVVVALDDASVRKNEANRQKLLELNWTVLADRLAGEDQARNGWFVARRPGDVLKVLL